LDAEAGSAKLCFRPFESQQSRGWGGEGEVEEQLSRCGKGIIFRGTEGFLNAEG
jgi:hypothetical protein